MGAIHSSLTSNDNNGPNPATRPSPTPIDSSPPSWISNKLHRDFAAKFSELELLSLRQVFQQLKQNQEKTSNSSESPALQHLHQLQQSHLSKQAKKDTRPVHLPPGITEPTFMEYLGFPSEKTRAGHLFFRSFCNLSLYPDSPHALPGHGQPPTLTLKDFIKPLALFCQKVNQETLMDVNPLKAIFESFAETGVSSPALHDTTIPAPAATTLVTDNSAPLNDQTSLKRTKTMEDSLRDLASNSNFEWSPDDEDTVDTGPSVKALDLIEVINGLLWLIQKIAVIRSNNNLGALQTEVSDSHLRRRATSIVEQMIQYSRTSDVLAPVDLSLELIDVETFSKYITRNAPNIFEVLSPYFYNLFLIGNTLSLSDATPESKFILPGVSSIPEMDSPSSIITPEHIALISWFLPLKKSTPSLTKLYNGSQHGFSMNQFEVHVCKYPAPTLFLLLVERQKTVAPTLNRRQSISFGNTTLRHKNSINNNSPTYSHYSTWGSDSRKSFDKLIGRSPTTPVSAGSVLSTIFDNVPPSTTNAITAQPNEVQSSSFAQRDSLGNTSAIAKPRRLEKERLILGAYVTETWKVSKAGWGNDAFALFEISPCFEVFPARKSSSSTTPSSSTKSLPIRTGARGTSTATTSANQQNRHYVHFLKNVGVGFGGQESESCMLYMDDNLQYGSYRQDFAGGNIYMNAGGTRQSGFEINFEIIECEVWGLGGPDAKARQKKEWDFEQREANRRASIHIRGKGDQEIDMDLLEMAGVIDPDRGHRHERRRQSAV
ncbi:Restriction of telomere capping protein 5 [Entomortierella chlamydospora]|nr:Restriction of telomere capping protein 5 [Entomortierella chlamydospora]